MFTKKDMAKGGRNQAKNIHQCPTCGDFGYANSMVRHMKSCDGSGVKNYYTRKFNKQLKNLF